MKYEPFSGLLNIGTINGCSRQSKRYKNVHVYKDETRMSVALSQCVMAGGLAILNVKY